MPVTRSLAPCPGGPELRRALKGLAWFSRVRRMSFRNGAVGAWWVMVAFCVGCSSEDGALSNNRFRDTAGRDCVVGDGDVSCTGGYMATCTAPEHPGFAVAGLESSPMQMCPGCFDSSGSGSYETGDACTQIVCKNAEDCGFSAAICRGGLCWCSPGDC